MFQNDNEVALTDKNSQNAYLGTTALMQATKEGNLDAIWSLVGKEAGRLNTRGDTALIIAARIGNYDGVSILAQYEAGIRAPGQQTALMHLSSLGGPKHLIHMLIPREVKLTDMNGWTALMFAAFWGRLDAVSALAPLEAGLQDHNGMTAMMHAVSKKRVDVVDYLASNFSEAEASRRNALGRTALMLAATTGGSAGFLMVQSLQRIEAKRQDSEGLTALMHAATYTREDNTASLELLANCECRMQDKSGKTALMHASLRGNSPALAILASREAQMIDKKGYCALNYCIEDYRVRLYPYLISELDVISRKSPYAQLFKRETMLIDLVFLSAHHRISVTLKQWLHEIVLRLDTLLTTHSEDISDISSSLRLCFELLMEYYLDGAPLEISDLLREYDSFLDLVLCADMCNVCSICLDRYASLIYLPCRHMVICTKCCDRSEALKNRCVVCKSDVSSTITVALRHGH